MVLTVTERPAAAVVAVAGEFLGSLHGPALRDAVAGLRARRRARVVLDLRGTTLMDSSGLGVLIEAATALRRDGGDLRVVAREGRLWRLFVMTGLFGRVFDLYTSPDEAAASFAREAAADG